LETYVAFWDITLVCLFGLVGRLLGGVFQDVVIAIAVAVARGGHVEGGWVSCVGRVSGVFGRCGRMEEQNSICGVAP
jgi:hypothetical protein